MTWILVVVLTALWLVGIGLQVGPLIHLLLVAALVVWVIGRLAGRRLT